LLISAWFVDGAITIGNPMQVVRGLTWEGHEFLDNIKNDDIWGKTKKHFSDFSGVELRIVASFAEEELKKKLHLSLANVVPPPRFSMIFQTVPLPTI